LKSAGLNLLEPSWPVQELLYIPFTFLHPHKGNYCTRNKEQTSNFVKGKESTIKKKASCENEKERGKAKYSDSITISPEKEPVMKVWRCSSVSASDDLMRTSMVTMAVMTVVLVIVGVLMLSLKAMSQQV